MDHYKDGKQVGCRPVCQYPQIAKVPGQRQQRRPRKLRVQVVNSYTARTVVEEAE